MRHRIHGRKLGRTSAHRKALFRNQVTALLDKERITTTLMKAKEVRPIAERMITLAKRESLHARRQVLKTVLSKEVVSKLFDSISARYADRPGGYTRIYKLGPRQGDNAEMAILELVDAQVVSGKRKEDKDKKKKALTPAEVKAKSEKAQVDKAKERKKQRDAERKTETKKNGK
jgi:large subunit ribosomal protein L17